MKLAPLTAYLLSSSLLVALPATAQVATSGVIDEDNIRFDPVTLYPASGGSLESASFDAFGENLAFDGGDLVVSAPLRDASSSSLDEGAVYTYEKDPSTRYWNARGRLDPPVSQAGQQFGSLARVGDRLVVASGRYDLPTLPDPMIDAGEVYVFRRVASAWVLDSTLSPSGPTALQAMDRLGDVDYEANLSGREIVVCGARFAGPSSEGRVWVFHRPVGSPSGSPWTQFDLPPPFVPAEPGASFGRVVIDGDRIAVSAELAAIPTSVSGTATPVSSAGAVYLYRKAPTAFTWSLETTIRPEFAAGGTPIPRDWFVFQDSRFGVALDLEGDFLVVGAPRIDVAYVPPDFITGPPIVGDEGAAYVFRRSGPQPGTWSFFQRLSASDGHNYDHFGQSVAIDRNTTTGVTRVVAGAPNEDDAFQDSGAAYVYDLESGGTSFSEVCKLPSCSTGQLFGSTVAVDQNSNRPRIAVAAPFVLPPPGAMLANPRIVAGSVTVYEELPKTTEHYRDFCFGDGGQQVDPTPQLSAVLSGCTPCPCGNDVDPATTPGPIGGCLNPENRSGYLQASGIPDTAADTLRFDAFGLSSFSFGLLFGGAGMLPLAGTDCPCGSGIQQSILEGIRCVGGGVVRHGSRPTDANGNTSNPWGNGSSGPITSAHRAGRALGRNDALLPGFLSGQPDGFALRARSEHNAGSRRRLSVRGDASLEGGSARAALALSTSA